MAVALSARNLAKTFGTRTLFTGVSLSIEDKERLAMIGPNGSGKSTLLNVIAGLDTFDSGSLLIDGVALNTLNDEQSTLLRREKLGFIFQAFHLLPHLNLLQNVALPLVLNKLPLDRANHMLACVGLASRSHDFPRQLSGGEMQRVAIARALVHQPRLLLADEPTGNLDPETAAEILSLLKNEIRTSGASAIIVTHSPAAAASADRVLQLTRNGLTEIRINSISIS
jgi:putative ABC transport system ATP-binding protein